MSELYPFIFEGLPVRGALVRLTDAWQEVLARRQANNQTGAYAQPVSELLGEMLAAGVLMQSSIKFNGALVLQIMGDGPVKLAVAEVQSDLSLRATASVQGQVSAQASLPDMVNLHNQGRCAITLDPKEKQPGQQPYQGVVPLYGDRRQKLEKLSDVIEHYMRQSEQLETRLVLAADERIAAGVLIQRMPIEGIGNLGAAQDSAPELDEAFRRIAMFTQSLKRDELLQLDADTVLRRLFWEEKLLRFEAQSPRFACSCSRERVGAMLQQLGVEEVQSILAEQNQIEVGCDYCGVQYRFDAVDAAQIFTQAQDQIPSPHSVQ